MSQTKAPAGGEISPVNQQFYEGGKFMPETGEFCGASKRGRAVAQKFTENWAEVIISDFFHVWVKLAGQTKRLLLTKKALASIDECKAFAQSAIDARAEMNIAKGFQPHPTIITISIQ